MAGCQICPRRCAIDRATAMGACRADHTVRIARVAPHLFEEPCISGQNGSGTIFFAGCNLRCIYCQNEAISRGKAGEMYSIEQLADAMRELDESAVHNINLVTSTHYADAVLDALALYQPSKPVVYNSSAYELPETLRRFEGKVSVYLPDYKYCDNTLAQAYSRVGDYSEAALAAIDEMVRQCPKPVFENGLMQRGVIVRHLVLPGHIDHSMKCLRILHERYGNRIYLSILRQYTPMKELPFAPLNRTVTDDEYELVCDYAAHLGIEQGFVQEKDSVGKQYIPAFEVTI